MTNTEINTVPVYLQEDYLKFKALFETQVKSKNSTNINEFNQGIIDILINNPSSFNNLSNHIAFAIYFIIEFDSSKMNQFNINFLPTWKKLSTCINIDKKFENAITKLQKQSQYELKIAILLIHIHKIQEH